MDAKEWLNNNELSYTIWNNKYRYKDENLDEWLDRVSGGNKQVRDLIKDKKFLFGGRILANRGLDKFGKKVTYSNCYVIERPEDNIESIFECGAKLARTYSYGGGCGIDVSNLRPKNAIVNNAADTTSGSTSFMDFFSYITGLIGQSGRRGALMISISDTHPDLLEFINLKSDLNICTKANISVRVSDDFMHAVDSDLDWKLYFKTEHEEIERTVKAREIFHLLAQRNWEMAEPGILYWDNIRNHNMLNTDDDFEYAGVNPCAEEPLPAGGSCLLGSLNLSQFIIHPFTERARFDYNGLMDATSIAVCALNDVLMEGIDLHPLAEQRRSVNDWRQIGLGTFGLADALIKLGLKYGSKESINFIHMVFGTIARTAIKTSAEIAQAEGCYPACKIDKLKNSDFILHHPCDVSLDKGLANSQLLTCAPTGSTATMFETSTGVEPNFAFSYTRRTVSLNKEETYYKVDAKIVEDYRKATGNTGELPDYFVASEQIAPIDRIIVQGALQQHIDASISSTINLPESTTVDEIEQIYFNAWLYGLKGVTIWRNNCQRTGILSTGEKKEETEGPKRGEILKASESCVGLKRTLTTGCGSLHCEAFFDPKTGDLRECYLSKGSTGGCNNFMISLSRMISLSARGGISIDNILDQLKSCGVCPSYAVRTATKKDTSKGSCCPVAVGNALKSMHEDMLKKLTNESVIEKDENLDECPQCHEKTLAHIGGCISCSSCGYSKCN
jgi:ribonucleoside-diphosphate reductase alpha chain